MSPLTRPVANPHVLAKLLYFLLISSFLATLAFADPNAEKAAPIKDGKDLLKVLRLALRVCKGEQLKTEQEKLDASHALGYVDGLKEASWVLDYANDSVPYILPTNIKNEQLAAVVLRYLTLHPEKQDKASYEIVALAFTEVFRNPKWKPLPDAPKSPEKPADSN